MTFLGGLHWPPNAAGMLWFVQKVWTLVAAQYPDALLTVIGKDPPADLSSIVDGRSSSIDITGYVDDPTPYLAETAAFIVPLHAGGGMRVKILDAWQWGLPIVSTTIGAEGIAVREGENMLLGDTPQTFAEAVLRLLREPELGARLRAGGRRSADQAYNWRLIYGDWDAVYGAGRP